MIKVDRNMSEFGKIVWKKYDFSIRPFVGFIMTCLLMHGQQQHKNFNTILNLNTREL